MRKAPSLKMHDALLRRVWECIEVGASDSNTLRFSDGIIDDSTLEFVNAVECVGCQIGQNRIEPIPTVYYRQPLPNKSLIWWFPSLGVLARWLFNCVLRRALLNHSARSESNCVE